MKKAFEELVTTLCALKELGAPAPYIGGSPFDVDGSMCTLIYNALVNRDQFFLYVVFGYAPRDKEALVFERLLQKNLLEVDGRAPRFCLSANTGKVGCVISLGLADTTADQLAGSLAYHANKAAEWRETFFL
ncbi:MAG: hypothetical protein A3I66_21145 [Burkholderiales bacterium RIFCSPLOWO2_02_FULL_57_36]|nr:MAG: hypothetical protein A3I66_21145 [Burkholderiales bacterium RIFCSPLOWO2_02_FULL_57_36]